MNNKMTLAAFLGLSLFAFVAKAKEDPNALLCQVSKIEGSQPNFFGSRRPQLPVVGDELEIDFTHDEIFTLISPAGRGIPLPELTMELFRTNELKFSKMNVFHNTSYVTDPFGLPKDYAFMLTKVGGATEAGPAHLTVVRSGDVVTLSLDCKN